MGQVFSQLTQPGTALQSPSGQTQAVGTPQQIQGDFYKQGAQQNASLPPGPTNFTGSHIGTPSFQDAASAGATPGAGNAMSPGLTKAGKLLTLMGSGIQGALAGHAANEQATVQSGGRRSGGAGMGFEAGYQLPWQRAEMGQQLQQQQAQTELLKAQSQMVPTPYGQMPAGLAKMMFPAMIRAGASENVAQTAAGAKENVAQTAAQSRLGVSQQNTRFKVVPGVGLIDTQTKQTIPGTQGLMVTPEMQQEYGLPPEAVGRPISQMTPFASLQRAQEYGEIPVAGTSGTSLVNRNPNSAVFGKSTNLGLGAPALGGPVQVGDPNNPGNTIMTTGARAVAGGMPGTQSSSVQVPKAAQERAVPTRIGDQTVAFNTAIQHATLLRQAAQALQNGNTRVLNSISNQAKSQFGDPDLTNFDAIANAYNHEVSSVISKGHITDKEVSTGGATMPSNANYATIDKVLNSYQGLMQSKMNMLNQQTNAAVKSSQPNRGQATASVDALVRKYGGH